MEVLYGQGGVTGGGIASFFPFILIMFVIYFLMIRPQMKQQKEKKVMLKNLKKGDKVVTVGGVRGVIAGFKEKNTVVVLTISKNVAIQVNKSAITGLFGVTKDGIKK